MSRQSEDHLIKSRTDFTEDHSIQNRIWFVTLGKYFFVFVLGPPRVLLAMIPRTNKIKSCDVTCSSRFVSQVPTYDPRESLQGVERIGVVEPRSFEIRGAVPRPPGEEGICRQAVPA